jgi:hypothetical protein
MVAVAILSLMMGGAVSGYRLKRRFDDFQSRAQYHEAQEYVCRLLDPTTRDLTSQYADLAKSLPVLMAELPRSGDERSESELGRLGPLIEATRRQIARLPRGHAYHAAMARKYRYAALHPWLRVEPDPPEPD